MSDDRIILNRTLVRRTPCVESDDLDVHPVLKQVYKNRDISDSRQLDYSLNNLLPPAKLSNLDEASDIIVSAIQANAPILIAGDFDADGATGSALGYLALTAFGARKVSYICPDRQLFGYGLTEDFVKSFAEAQPDLVITVDNGITSLAGVRLAREYGMSVVITDHHLPGDELPEADSIVNPRLPGDQFGSKNLAGVGVMWYVMSFVRKKLREEKWFESEGIAEPNMAHYLDLVAVGTIADVVPLDYNNRILVSEGLKLINRGCCRYGIRCLLEESGKRIGDVVSEDLAFTVGPKLNAAGRLDDISYGVKCLVSTDAEEVRSVVKTLERLNITRKSMEVEMVQAAKEEVRNTLTSIQHSMLGVCLYNADWHQGIVGLIASRVREYTGKPAIIFAPDNEGRLRGSGRSIQGLNLRDVLASIEAIEPEIFVQYGGHAMAAGMTLFETNLERFKSLYQEELSRQLGDRKWENQILSDGEICDLGLEAAEEVRSGGPWGQQFEEPVFDGIFNVVSHRMLKNGHLSVRLSSPNSNKTVAGIFFRYSNYHSHPPENRSYRCAFHLVVNEFRGSRKPQLNLIYMSDDISNVGTFPG
ncbi:MAG: single-stranded-DNA-specific exonuclease RecJ [Gammaproteobacteria bacterium]|nr:single-stranded-DNA-specific exonuclease RecJ [Gammaproteobacteria bacterium]